MDLETAMAKIEVIIANEEIADKAFEAFRDYELAKAAINTALNQEYLWKMTLEELKKDPMKVIERVAKSKDINALIKVYEKQRKEQRKRYKNKQNQDEYGYSET